MSPTEGSGSAAVSVETHDPQRSPGLIRLETRRLAEVAGMCGLAVAQPLLDLFGRAPQQFAFRAAADREIIAFALLVGFAVPVVVWATGFVVGLVHPTVRRAAHLGTVGLLAAVFAVQALRPLAGGPALFLLATLAGVTLVVAYIRWRGARMWLSYLAVAPAAFVVMFLLASPTARLLQGADALEAGSATTPAPVVMLLFDELPLVSVLDSEGKLDAELFPNLAALAEDSHWFRNATTVASSTWHAAPALVTGNAPEAGEAPIAADHPDSLFTLLADDHELNVVESVTRVCPSEVCVNAERLNAGGLRGLLRDAGTIMKGRLSWSGDTGDSVAALVEAQGGHSHDGGDGDDDGDPRPDGWSDFSLNQPARFTAFTDGIVDGRPALHYLHVLLPHVPYRYLPSGATYDGPTPDLGRVAEDEWGPQQTLADLGRQRHLLQVGYVDHLVGEVVRTLKDRGIYDDALVVVTSDHGISFTADGPIRGIEGEPMSRDLITDLAWIPLIVKTPGQEIGVVSDDPVMSIDIVPTIAEVVGIDIPWDVDGRSLFGPPRSNEARYFYPSDVTTFGIGLGDRIDPGTVSSLESVRSRGVDTFLTAVGDPQRWWKAGPRPDLVGRRLSTTTGLTPVNVELFNGDFSDVDPSTGEVPALIRGFVDDVAEGDAVVVAVNGTIAASARIHVDLDRTQVAVIVSDAVFRAGNNDVTVHRVAPAPN